MNQLTTSIELCFRFLILNIFLLSSIAAQVNSSVGIGAPPDNSAILDIQDSTRGVLFPRLTINQRNLIQNPAHGLVIFNLDCGVLNYNSGTSISPIWETVISTNMLVPSVSISQINSGPLCPGDTGHFTAIPGMGLTGVSYQWKLNGLAVGTNSSTFSSVLLADGDQVTCDITTSSPCAVGSSASSNVITITTASVPGQPVLILGASNACENSTSNAYSVAFQQGVTSYLWTVPAGASVTSGQNTASVLISFGVTSGNVEVVASNSCGSGQVLQVPVSLSSAPSVPGQISGSASPLEFATGVVYSIAPVAGATSYIWSVPPGASVTGGQGSLSATVTFGNTSGNISVIAINGCDSSTASVLPVTLVIGGQALYDTPGTYSWVCPAGVTSVCVVAIGGGAGGGTGNYGAGAGGGLGWRNNITVVPGVSYTVQVGSGGAPGVAGGNSFFINTSTVAGFGGASSGGNNPSNTSPLGGGSFTGDGGGNGGGYMGTSGGGAISGGGGGAGGYTGVGGRGGGNTGTAWPATAGSGGGGGGGAGTNAGGTNHGGGGGGTGVLGAGANGSAGPNQTSTGGGGGSGGQNGVNGQSTGGGAGGAYGGGGAGRNGGSGTGGAGAGGAVRIIWGPNRAFPSTNTQNI